MRIAITGAEGFLGWHLACRAHAQGTEPVRIGRSDFGSAFDLAAAIGDADAVVHLAGVNRAPSDDEVEEGNVTIARRLADALDLLERPVHVVYGNSVQAERDVPYGRGKRRGGEVLADACARHGGAFADVRLPNIFGEHGRPHYNSFVATFCHELAAGREPTVAQDREVPLLHAQTAADVLIRTASSGLSGRTDPPAERRRVTDVLADLRQMHTTYARGEVPDLSDDFETDLFNTYRSFVFPERFPFRVRVNADQRGHLFETVRAHGGQGQAFVSTTVPGARRGDHYHLRKVERFFVVRGRAEIALRRLYDDHVVRFTVSGDEPAFVDMPTLWVHNIANVGDDELVTMFWSDQLLDPAAPDQFPELVDVEEAVGA